MNQFFFANAIFISTNHPAAPILKEMESLFGTSFEAFSKDELLALIASIATECDQGDHWLLERLVKPSNHLAAAITLTDQLAQGSNDIAISLIPFLIEQMEGR